MMAPRALQRGIGRGLILLVALMPFHAFFSVWLGSITGHEAVVQSWKELLLAILAILGVILAVRDAPSRERLRSWPFLAAGVFVGLALVVTVFTRPSLTAMMFGAKIDFEFLVAFALAAMVATPKLIRTAIYTVLITSAIVFVFATAEAFWLPHNFLAQFGYGPHTIEPNELLGPITRTIRYEATLGGPNQLGTFALLPLSLAIAVAARKRQWLWLLILPPGLVALTVSYSRGAWLGGVAAALVLSLVLISHRLRAALLAAYAAIGLVGALVLEKIIHSHSKLRTYIFHSGTQSDALHMESLTLGLKDSLMRPLGHGLGTAGPAVFHTGGGLIIEDFYLQLSYESGVAGLLAFVVVIVTLVVELARRAVHSPLACASLAALVGISITCLFLPAWTDSSTALIFWTCAGLAIGVPPESHSV